MRPMDQVYWGNSVYDWLVAFAVMAGCVILFVVARGLLARRLLRLAGRTRTDIDDALVELVRNTKAFFLLILSAKIAVMSIALPQATHAALNLLVTLACIAQGGIWGNTLIGFWFTRTMKERMAGDITGTTSLNIIKFIGRIVLWTILLLVALDTMGVNITAFITTLGVGGIAIALALQNVLGDLFASLSIVFDKPFVVGDSIVVDAFQGTVEHIGMKTTRIRSIGGEQIIISNSELLTSRIRNYGRMAERRVLFSIGVTYQTPVEKLEKIPGMIEQIVAAIPGTRFDRAHFLRFGDYSLLIEAVYFVLSSDYLEYVRVHQAVNLGILKSFREHGIGFAYPTQKVHIEQ